MDTTKLGSIIKIRPEYEQRYCILHKHVFPGVLNRIAKSNINNYSIFHLDGILFSYYEYVGNDYKKDMKDLADSTTKDWWKLTDPMQEPLPTRKEGEWWAAMEQLFCFKKLLRSSSELQRIGLTVKVIPGKEETLISLCKNIPHEVEEETYKHNFQNCTLYFKDGNVYCYYEYVGINIRKDLDEVRRNETFTSFQTSLNECLLMKDARSWQEMKEVFHTD
jgi:L-rhamnose mutarotase